MSRSYIDQPNPYPLLDDVLPGIFIPLHKKTILRYFFTGVLQNKIFGVEDKLKDQGLDLIIRRITFHGINLDQIDSFFFRCPKIPSDTEARIGVRTNPKNPGKVEKIFGYNAIITTAIEPSLGLELPVACLTISGNAEEGNQFIPLK